MSVNTPIVYNTVCELHAAALLEFRARESRDPDIDHADTDPDKLKEIAVELLKSNGIREDFLDLDFTSYVSLVVMWLLADLCQTCKQ